VLELRKVQVLHMVLVLVLHMVLEHRKVLARRSMLVLVRSTWRCVACYVACCAWLQACP
jgi:hypothetical protein